MKLSDYSNHIGFPAPLLGEKSVRLPVLHLGSDIVALYKPAGVLVAPEKWYRKSLDLQSGITQQIESGKPELARLGIGKVDSVFHLDLQGTGIALFALSEAALEFYRNQWGSRQMKFVYTLLVREAPGREAEISCDLPLARHRSKPRMVVTHRSGKQSSTVFRRVDRVGGFSIWEAKTEMARMHQIRIHAWESGLLVAGETTYDHVGPIFLSQFKRNYRVGIKKQVEKPLFADLGVHLGRIEFESMSGESIVVEVPVPDKLNTVIKMIRKYVPVVQT